MLTDAGPHDLGRMTGLGAGQRHHVAHAGPSPLGGTQQEHPGGHGITPNRRGGKAGGRGISVTSP